MKIKGKARNVQAVILACLGVAGILALGAVAPNAVQLLRYFPGVNKSKKNYYAQSTLFKLRDKGLIEFVKKNGKTFAKLTNKGKQKLNQYKLGDLNPQKPKHWNGKWHIVIFDIKEVKHQTRDQLRLELIRFNFCRLQNSVWVSPYECEEFITMLKTSFELGRAVIYIVADKVEND